MSDEQGEAAAAEAGPEIIRIPFWQRVMDNPFLLLFLGIAMPTVLYILWGVMEVLQIPVAK